MLIPRPGRQRGVTLIEAMVAMLLLLVITLGILPLFTRSMAQNASGGQATQTANHVRGHLDRLEQMPFNNLELQITSGNSRVNNAAYYAGDLSKQGDEHWAAVGAGTGIQLWTGVTTVRQFSLRRALDADLDGAVDGFEGLEDGNHDGEFDNPLTAGTDPAFIHVKELDVLLTHEREEGNPIESPRPYRVRRIKPF